MAAVKTTPLLCTLYLLLCFSLPGFTQPEMIPPSYSESDGEFNMMTPPDTEQVTALLVRYFAISALKEKRDPRAIPALTEATHDPVASISLAAHGALALMGNAESLEIILTAIRNTNPSIRLRATENLKGLPDPRVLPALADVIGDQASNVRHTAAWILHDSTDLRIVEPLLAWVKSENLSIRRCAIYAFSATPDPRALDALIATVSDPQTDMSLEGVATTWNEQRIQAAQSLGKIKDRRAVPLLITALDSTDKACKARLRAGAERHHRTGLRRGGGEMAAMVGDTAEISGGREQFRRQRGLI